MLQDAFFDEIVLTKNDIILFQFWYLREDHYSTGILRRCGAGHYQAYAATGDGNCLFNSISLSLFSNESYTHFLRLISLVYLVKNVEVLKQQKIFGCQNISSSILELSRPGVWSDMLHIYCAAHALHIEISSLYPPLNGMCDVNIFKQPHFFQPPNAKCSIEIMWSGPTIGSYFLPNHFVPVSAVDNGEFVPVSLATADTGTNNSNCVVRKPDLVTRGSDVHVATSDACVGTSDAHVTTSDARSLT